MEIALLLVSMLVIWLFIRYDQKRLREKPKPLEHSKLENGYIPGLSVKWLGYAGGSLFCAISAALSWFKPITPPFIGKWSLLRQFLHSLLGQYGVALVFATTGVFFAYAAVMAYRKITTQKKKQNAA
jgi:hypothetical protein